MAPYPDLVPRYKDCASGYQWYTCNLGGQSYAGCCSVDPCGSKAFCPAEHQQPSSTSSKTEMVTSTVAPPVSATADTKTADPSTKTTTYITSLPATTAPATAPNAAVVPTTTSATLSATAAPQSKPHSGGGFPTGAIVGVVVGSIIVTTLLAILCLWRRKSRKKGRKAGRGGGGSRAGSGSAESEKEGYIVKAKGTNSPLLAVSPPSPGHVFDEFGGRYHAPDSPSVHHSRTSHLSIGGQSTLVSPLTPPSTHTERMQQHQSQQRQELDSSPLLPELDSKTVTLPKSREREFDFAGSSGDSGGGGGARASPPRVVQSPSGERPRATLRATDEDRRSMTYANSWTTFQNVQV